MAIGILGKKMGMTQIFEEDGKVYPATVVEAGPCKILQLKTQDKEGYTALQCGFGKQKESRITKPLKGHLKKSNSEPVKFVKEIRLTQEEAAEYKAGDELKVDLFRAGDFVDITGVSIGKGFQGVMKRWNFRGHPASHGSTIHRAPGSIGASADPSRVFKGQHMAGRMGGKQVTVQNVKVLKIDTENNLLILKGSIPGAKGSNLLIKLAKKKTERPPAPQVADNAGNEGPAQDNQQEKKENKE
jgi:large subunit ribosomal protein L3